MTNETERADMRYSRNLTRLSWALIASIVAYFAVLAAGVLADQPTKTYIAATLAFFAVQWQIARVRRRITVKYLEFFRQYFDEKRQQHKDDI